MGALALVALCVAGCRPAAEEGTQPETEPEAPAASRVHVTPESDPKAVEIAEAVVERIGGWEAWDDARVLSWNFFGRRSHYWDRWTGDVRIEGPAGEDRYLWLMNVGSGTGRVWKNGDEITEPGVLAEALEQGRKIWVNDSYWVVMPFKLLDPGVTLKHAGERPMTDGRLADVLDVTFADGVGYTPRNRYEVFVAKDTGLVEQWTFFADASDEEPRFTLPWQAWRPFGGIMLATDHGQGKNWEIAVHEEPPAGVFTDPGPVDGT